MLTPNLKAINDQYPCRYPQIQQLATLFNPQFPTPSTLVIHGLEATCKTILTRAILDAIGVPYALIKCKECITTRHLLEHALRECRSMLDAAATRDDPSIPEVDGRCENIGAFAAQLQTLLGGLEMRSKRRLVLVFDGVDKQREATPTLLPALARLGEIIPSLSTVLIVTFPRARFLHAVGIPHISFPAYTRSEILTILSRQPRLIDPSHSSPPKRKSQAASEQGDGSSENESTSAEPPKSGDDDIWLWTHFCAAIWDALGKATARDLISFRIICDKLWPVFVQPVREGILGAQEFSKLLIRNRSLLQGEATLVETLGSSGSLVLSMAAGGKAVARRPATLPYHPSYILIASYLASYTAPRHDTLLFTRANETKKRKRRRGGGAGAGVAGRPPKHRRIQRRLLGPSPFVLERMLAIFHAILPRPMPTGGAADVLTQVATLASLRLIVRGGGGDGGAGGGAGGGVGGIGATEGLMGGGKWRVAVGWEVVKGVARGVGCDIEDYMID